MGMLKNMAVKLLFGKFAGKMPKVIDAKTHGVIDYAHATLFLSAGLYFWKEDRRAAVVTLTTGAFLLTEALLTDYPFGAKPLISFPMHGRLDRGFVGFAAAAPRTFEFQSKAAMQFYRANSFVEAAVVSLTDFEHPYANLSTATAASPTSAAPSAA